MYGRRKIQSTPNTENPTTLCTVSLEHPDHQFPHRFDLAVQTVLLLPDASLGDCLVDRGDLEAALLRDHLAARVVDRDVRVVRDVVRDVADVPRLAEHVGLL